MSDHEAPELGAACIRMMRALARRAGQGELEALEQLAFLQDSVQLQLGAAVAGYRAFQPAHGAAPYSWTDVGNALGITRQSAQGRFGRATTDPAHGPRCVCDSPQCPNYVELPDLVELPHLPSCPTSCTDRHYS